MLVTVALLLIGASVGGAVNRLNSDEVHDVMDVQMMSQNVFGRRISPFEEVRRERRMHKQLVEDDCENCLQAAPTEILQVSAGIPVAAPAPAVAAPTRVRGSMRAASAAAAPTAAPIRSRTPTAAAASRSRRRHVDKPPKKYNSKLVTQVDLKPHEELICDDEPEQLLDGVVAESVVVERPAFMPSRRPRTTTTTTTTTSTTKKPPPMTTTTTTKKPTTTRRPTTTTRTTTTTRRPRTTIKSKPQEPRKIISSRYKDNNVRGTVNDLEAAVKKEAERDYVKKWDDEHEDEYLAAGGRRGSSSEEDPDESYYVPRRISYDNDEPAIYRTVTHIQRSVIKHTFMPEDD